MGCDRCGNLGGLWAHEGELLCRRCLPSPPARYDAHVKARVSHFYRIADAQSVAGDHTAWDLWVSGDPTWIDVAAGRRL